MVFFNLLTRDHFSGCLRCVSAIALALTVSTAFAQLLPYEYYEGEPPGGVTSLEKHTIVTPDGKVILNAFDFYNYGLMTLSDHLSDVPANFSQVMFSLSFDYMSPAGDEMPYDILWPMSGLGIYSDTLPLGYYRNTVWRFQWQNGTQNESRIVYSDADLIIPTLSKIPVYVYAGALNKSFLELDNRILDMLILRTKFLEFGEEVSSLLTNKRPDLENNYGCAGWVDFRFYGYVEGFDEPFETADLARLPPGLTIVPSIKSCSGEASNNMIMGCSTVGGDRIAVAEAAFREVGYPSDIIVLHEVGHLTGMGHDDSQERLVMNSLGHGDDVGILKSHCSKMALQKQLVFPEPWRKRL